MASLRFRIVFLLIAAVLPAAILVCAFAYHSFDVARTNQIATLERNADFLLSQLDLAGDSALSTAATLATSGGLPGANPEECATAAGALVARYAAYSGLAVLENGKIVCEHSRPGSPAVSPLEPTLLDSLVNGTPLTSLRTLAEDRPALLAGSSGLVPAARGVAVVLMLDNSFLAGILGSFHAEPSTRAALFDRSARLAIAPNAALEAALWPASGLPLVDGRRTVALAAASGEDFVYTTAKLRGFDLWLVTGQREADVLDWPVRQLIVTAVAPLVMIAVVTIAIWIGLQSSVLRWVSALRNATRAYSAGAITSRVGDASQAPREFAELAASFDALADRMAERTLELEREVASKTNYIREIHHRVKNNLQVIGSLLALQKREIAVEQRSILRFAEDRVNAMSAAYRASYAVSEIGLVPLGNVVREVAHRLQASGDARQARFDLQFTGGELEIDLDTAVSVAMLMAEILPAYTDAADKAAQVVHVVLDATRDRLWLTIRGPESTERQSFLLARRFIQAYLRQLNASIDESVPGETKVQAPFPVPAKKA